MSQKFGCFLQASRCSLIIIEMCTPFFLVGSAIVHLHVSARLPFLAGVERTDALVAVEVATKNAAAGTNGRVVHALVGVAAILSIVFDFFRHYALLEQRKLCSIFIDTSACEFIIFFRTFHAYVIATILLGCDASRA